MAEGSRRERKAPEVRRAQILDAAAELFLARGADRTSMSQVATAAGVAKGTPYLYFDSKEELLTALRDRYLKDWYEEVERLLAHPQPGSERRQFEEFLRAMYEFHSDKVELHHLLLSDEGAEDQIIDRSRKLLLEFVRSGARSGGFRVTNLEATVDFVLHGLHGLLVSYLHQGCPGEMFTADAMTVIEPILSEDA